MSILYSLERFQKIPVSQKDIWDFISYPENLNLITPPSMSFKIISNPGKDKIYPGQLIEYKISPFPGIKMGWVTEITHVREQAFFVDEQRFGPYAFWHHQHHITPIEGGVLMTDILHYRLPLGILGRIVHTVDVKKRLEKIFEYRYGKIEAIFGKFQGS